MWKRKRLEQRTKLALQGDQSKNGSLSFLWLGNSFNVFNNIWSKWQNADKILLYRELYNKCNTCWSSARAGFSWYIAMHFPDATHGEQRWYREGERETGLHASLSDAWCPGPDLSTLLVQVNNIGYFFFYFEKCITLNFDSFVDSVVNSKSAHC